MQQLALSSEHLVNNLRSLVAVLLLILCGCTPQIPNKVSSEEYELYNAWISQSLHRSKPKHLLIDTQTFKIDPLGPYGCGDSLHRDGIPWSQIKALHVLGDAQYSVDERQIRADMDFRAYYPGYTPLPKEDENYDLVSFSRAAFNHSRDAALFAENSSCGGLCGAGGYVYAVKDKGGWIFRSVGCHWIS